MSELPVVFCQNPDCLKQLEQITYTSGAKEKPSGMLTRRSCPNKVCRKAVKAKGLLRQGHPPRIHQPEDKYLDMFNFKLLVDLQRMI